MSVEMLVDKALERGATDNVTVVGVQLRSTAPSDG
jgi:serine/threonine protein phosphatase PrpC